jgi:hypothetical protein
VCAGRGAKVVALRKIVATVHAPNLDVSLWNLRRHNSIMRLALPRLCLLLLLLVSFWLGIWLADIPWATWVAVAALLPALLIARRVMAVAVGDALENCVQLVEHALDSLKAQGRSPDFIIGSSWGGAVVRLAVFYQKSKTKTKCLVIIYVFIYLFIF